MDYLNQLTTASIIATGLMAGLYLGWAISVLPGLSLLSNNEYLNAFQKLNRAILNPRFKSLFIATLVLPLITTVAHSTAYGFVNSWLLFAASGLLVLGHGAITLFGNIPINTALDSLDLTSVRSGVMIQQRLAFESRWHAWHWGRTIATCLAFALLLAR